MDPDVSSVLLFGGFGPVEIGILVAIVVLIFGAQKIPDLANNTGRAMAEFQKGRNDIEQAIQREKAASLDSLSGSDPRQESSETDSSGDTTSNKRATTTERENTQSIPQGEKNDNNDESKIQSEDGDGGDEDPKDEFIWVGEDAPPNK